MLRRSYEAIPLLRVDARQILSAQDLCAWGEFSKGAVANCVCDWYDIDAIAYYPVAYPDIPSSSVGCTAHSWSIGSMFSGVNVLFALAIDVRQQ